MPIDVSPWLAAIVESAEEALVSKSLDGTILTWNAAAERLYGYSAGEVVGRHISMLAPADLRGEIDALLVRMARGERIAGHETRRVRKDGTAFEAALTISPVRDANGVIVGAATTTRDIGSKRAIEEAKRQAQKLEAIGRLAGGVAHDFNNLLTAILGYGSLALEGVTGDSAREAVEEIIHAADRAGDLTRQLLAFSRRAPRVTKTLSVNTAVAGLQPLLRRIVGEDLDLVFELGDDVPPVEGDPTQIEQIIVNLVANARDAMPRGGRVVIETHRADLDTQYAQAHPGAAPGAYAMLSVTDSGVGMDAETRAHLFEPFFTTKEVGTGTGLGLATVYGIVEQSGGHIWFYSEPGHGAVFKIYLPASPRACPSSPQPGRKPATHGEHETVLVVEDDPGLLEMAAAVLEHGGYEVVRVTDATAALRAFEEGAHIDLLVTDVVLPGMSGPELARELAERGHDIPTIFMSGYSSDAVVRNGLLDVVEEYLDKPFAPDLLLERVHAALHAREAVT